MPDGVYHVTSRGLERRPIVRDDIDRARWLELLDRVAARRDWRVLGWALMDNHYHLFVRTPNPDLSAGVHDLGAGYATGFNRRHRRVGPLFQGRFKAVLVQRDYHYWELSRYVHLNPVRAGLVSVPEHYPWSSCRFCFSSRGAPAWLAWEEVLGQHGRTMRTAREAYHRFLAEGVASPPPSPLGDATASTLLGSPQFLERMKAWLQDRLPDRDVPAARALRRAISMDEIIRVVADVFGVSGDQWLTARGTHHNDARSAAIHLCHRFTPVPVEQIGQRFGGIQGSAVCHLLRRLSERRQRDRHLDRLLGKAQRQVEVSIVKT